MLFILAWIPVATSLVLGVVYLYQGEARPAFKVLGVALFGAAVYLQFFSRHSLVGLVLQVVLAVGLALWWRMGRLE
jgi:hypothetical protein